MLNSRVMVSKIASYCSKSFNVDEDAKKLHAIESEVLNVLESLIQKKMSRENIGEEEITDSPVIPPMTVVLESEIPSRQSDLPAASVDRIKEIQEMKKWETEAKALGNAVAGKLAFFSWFSLLCASRVSFFGQVRNTCWIM